MFTYRVEGNEVERCREEKKVSSLEKTYNTAGLQCRPPPQAPLRRRTHITWGLVAMVIASCPQDGPKLTHEQLG